MSLTKLKLNPEKTEFIVFGSKAKRQKISSYFPVSILGSLLHPVDSVRNLGMWFDAEFSFSEHVKRSNLRHTSITINWIIHISQLISQDTPLKQLYCQ